MNKEIRNCDTCFYQDDSDNECYERSDEDCFAPPLPEGKKAYGLWKSRKGTRNGKPSKGSLPDKNKKKKELNS